MRGLASCHFVRWFGRATRSPTRLHAIDRVIQTRSAFDVAPNKWFTALATIADGLANVRRGNAAPLDPNPKPKTPNLTPHPTSRRRRECKQGFGN